jgi:hypothetical protein
MVKKRKSQVVGAKGPGPVVAASAAALKTRLPLRYQVIVSLLILITGICVLYPELVFQDKMFVAGDVEAALSFSTPIKKALKEGDYPLWNPYLYSGMPSYGSLSYAPYVYPVTLFTGFLVTGLKFPNSTWLLFHIFVLGLGVWLLLRDRGVHFVVAALAGVLMMWMPNHVAVGAHGHGSQASAVGYMPLALFFWDRLWRGKGALLNASVLVILLGFQFLRAHLQISYYTFALLGLHLAFFACWKIADAWHGRASHDPPVFGFLIRWRDAGSVRKAAVIDVLGAAVVLGLIVVASLAISAVLFGPVQEYAQHSIRGASQGGGLDYEYATSWSLHPLESVSFVLPFAFGFGKHFYFGHMPFTDYPNYVGIVVALFAVCAVAFARTRYTWFLAIIVGVTTLVAFGKHLPVLYDPLFKLLPYFNKFRVPVMVLIVQQLALVLLFGLGLSAVVAYSPIKGRKKALWGIAASLVILVIVVLSHGYWTERFPAAIAARISNVRSAQDQLQIAHTVGGLLASDLLKMSVFLIGATSAAWLFFRRRLAALPFALVVLALALIDLFLVDRHIIHPEKLFRVPGMSLIGSKDEGKRVLEPDALIEFLRAQEGYYRVFPMTHPSAALFGDFRTNRYMNFSISSIGGYHPAKLAAYEDYLEALGRSLERGHFHMADILNVRYLVTSNALPENPTFPEVWRGVDYVNEPKFVYENSRALPRLFFVDDFQVHAGAEALERLAAGADLDFSRTVLLEKTPAISPVSRDGATATIIDYRMNEIRVKASLPSAAILVQSEIFYPEWKVDIDGRPGEIIRANHVLRAVALPAGDHELVFRFDMSLLNRCLTISVIAFSVALLLLLFALGSDLRGRVKWKHS